MKGWAQSHFAVRTLGRRMDAIRRNGVDPFMHKVAIVTGGASGIGRAICEYLARHGATVIIGDRNLAGARTLQTVIASNGGHAEAAGVDVTDEEAIKSLIDGVQKRHGRIDHLFNNAGISVNGEFKDMTAEHWRQVVDVNLWGVVYGCRHAYPIMMRQGSGHIINTASLAGLIPGGLTSGYSAAKHAAVGFTLTLRSEARLYGIRVSALCPGYIRTGIQATTPSVSAFLDSPKNRAMNVRMRFPMAEDCIEQIMRGVRRNKGIILAPGRQRVYWWLHRLLPELMPNVFTRIIARMKRNV